MAPPATAATDMVVATSNKKKSSDGDGGAPAAAFVHPFLRRLVVLLLSISGPWFWLVFELPTPVHQMQQYYRQGVLDNCFEKWSAVFDCLSLKTKRSSEVQEILEAREKGKPHIWSFRTPEEAAANWKETFGHLDEME
ncbi:hypothetical protein AKJ16_DCAP03995 [Drosera capensis]